MCFIATDWNCTTADRNSDKNAAFAKVVEKTLRCDLLNFLKCEEPTDDSIRTNSCKTESDLREKCSQAFRKLAGSNQSPGTDVNKIVVDKMISLKQAVSVILFSPQRNTS